MKYIKTFEQYNSNNLSAKEQVEVLNRYASNFNKITKYEDSPSGLIVKQRIILNPELIDFNSLSDLNLNLYRVEGEFTINRTMYNLSKSVTEQSKEYPTDPTKWFFDVMEEPEHGGVIVAISTDSNTMDDQLGSHNLPQTIKNVMKRAGVFTDGEATEGTFEVESDTNIQSVKRDLESFGFNHTTFTGGYASKHLLKNISTQRTLTDLKGFPKIVTGSLDVSSNDLTSLEGCPEIMGKKGFFSFNKNLTSIRGICQNIEIIALNRCLKLTSLEGIGQVKTLFIIDTPILDLSPLKGPKEVTVIVSQKAKEDFEAVPENVNLLSVEEYNK